MHKEKTKILHLITGLEIGGAEMMLLKTLPLLKREYDIHVCCIRGQGPIGKQLEKKGIPVTSLHLQHFFDVRIIKRFKTLVKTFQPDILITYLIHADLFGRIFGRIWKIPTIISFVRVKLIEKKYFPLILLDFCTSFLLDARFFVSKTTQTFYERWSRWKGLFSWKSFIVPNGIDLKMFGKTTKKRQDLKISSSEYLIGYTAKLRPQKGHALLLNALAKITSIPWKLLLIGGGSEETALKQQAQNLNLSNRILFLGDRNDVSELLPLLDLFVFPTFYEGMSNALLEAAASHCLIVASDIPENKEVLFQKHSGIFVQTNNQQSLKEGILLAHKTTKKQQTLFKNNTKKCAKHFSLQASIEAEINALSIWG